MRIAVIGAGIAGLGAAWLLHRQGQAVTLFEANDYLGGHTHTVDVTVDGVIAPVDTGFLVFNDRTYPKLVALFDELGVDSVASEMSFSARIDSARLEWAGTSFLSLFAQPSSALRPAFWRMLADVARFNREATNLLENESLPRVGLGEFLDQRQFGRAFRDWYLLPMAAAIWSSPQREILDFPLPTFVRFCHNHGLLRLHDRPQWRTVLGGGRVYVEKIASRLPDVRRSTPVRRIRRGAQGVDVDAAGCSERFDEVVLACHSDQARRLLSHPTPSETTLLSAIRYQTNRVVVHTDLALLPRSRRAWSAWNYLSASDADGTRRVAVSYLINRLQPLPFATPVIVTLNPPFEPDPALTLDELEYSHPLLDRAAVVAQAAFGPLQGNGRTWYAGAWLGHGFHEDGLRSAHAVAAGIADLAAASHSSVATAIIHGEIVHRRTRPTAHAFKYPAFCLRLPLSKLDELERFGIAYNRRALVSFHDHDHGPCDGTALEPWMRALLAREGVAVDGDIVLHAFPRMLGYVFNPISFWVCHDSCGAVRAVLCEVRNTFRERHLYLLANADGAPLASGDTLATRKVFHVSPFCDVVGRYAFRFHFGAERWLARIDYFDDGNSVPLLETWISGHVEAATAGVTRKLVWRYRWFTVAVVTRIHWQALKLWLKRVPYFTKPAPPRAPLSR